MAIFDWMANMAIDSAGGGKSVFGDKPQVADYVPTDLGTESQKATEANVSNLPGIQALLDKILPGWSDMQKEGSKNTLSLLRGEIPQDVQDQLRRNSAYKSFTGGYGGSGMSKALTARDFGLTSLDLMGKGENSAQRWMGMSEGAVSPWTITGKEQADQTMKNNLYQQAVDQFKYNVMAAPDPASAGLFNTIATIGGTAASFGMGSAMNAQRSGGGTAAPAGGVGGGGGGGVNGASNNPYYGWINSGG
jgi:hypothetical protein